VCYDVLASSTDCDDFANPVLTQKEIRFSFFSAYILVLAAKRKEKGSALGFLRFLRLLCLVTFVFCVPCKPAHSTKGTGVAS